MLVNLNEGKDDRRVVLRTVECSLCGARWGREYRSFSSHVEQCHGPEDVGLESRGDRQTRLREVTV